MQKAESPQKQIDKLLAQIANLACDVPAVATSYVLVVEYFTETGEYFVDTLSSDEQPVWRLQGLMNYAIENLTTDYETEDIEQDDE
jgi:hypothetical protein